MITKTKKELKNSYEIQSAMLHIIYEELNKLEPTETYKVIIVDIKKFLSDEFCSKRKGQLTLQPLSNQIKLLWSSEEFFGEITFYGNANWEYHFTKKEIKNNQESTFKMSFKGQAYSFICMEKKHHAFLLEEAIDGLTKEKDEFEYDYQPLFKIDRANRNLPDHINYGWTTSVWDGPLAGYCYYNQKLCYFDLEEETEYDRNRMYVIYKLNLLDKIKAYWTHYRWTHITRKYKWIWNLHLWNYKRKPFDSKKAEIKHKKFQLWKNKKEKLGYFSM